MSSDSNLNVTFIFSLNLRYSGTTALAQIIASSPLVGSLNERAEGQWLVPQLGASDRWNPQKPVDWDEVRATWNMQIANNREPSQNFIFEKSPPHLVRFSQLVAVFPNYLAFVYTRNPLGQIASELARFPGEARWDSKEYRGEAARSARDWLEAHERLANLVETYSLPKVSYEHFVREPIDTLRRAGIPEEIVTSIRPRGRIRVKNYRPQPLRDYNRRQIRTLDRDTVTFLTQRLMEREDLLEYFDYLSDLMHSHT